MCLTARTDRPIVRQAGLLNFTYGLERLSDRPPDGVTECSYVLVASRLCARPHGHTIKLFYRPLAQLLFAFSCLMLISYASDPKVIALLKERRHDMSGHLA